MNGWGRVVPDGGVGGRARSRIGWASTGLAPIVMVLLWTPMALAAPGDLDPTFSGDGTVTTDLGGSEFASGVTLQADGKIVAVGGAASSGSDASSDGFAVVRYEADGSLDSGFSGDGIQTTDFAGLGSQATAVALQGDGKIVVGGFRYREDGADFALARYNLDGSLDATFSEDGKQITAIGDFSLITGIAVQSDGKIVAVGESESEFAVARYSSDGSLDTTFSSDGTQTTVLGGGFPVSGASSVVLQPNGKILAAGDAYDPGGTSDFALVRYNSDGSLDGTFSGDGRVTTDFGASDDATGLALQSDGKIVAVGGSGVYYSDERDFAVARYNADGSLDTSFSADGRQTTDFGGFDTAGGVAVQPDGKLVAAGAGGAEDSFALARYQPDGSLDATFSGDGKQITVLGEFAWVGGVALQDDGRILAVGRATFSETWSDIVVARYEGGDVSSDTTPPETTIDSGPSGATSDSTPTFEFSSSEPGSTFECRVDTAAFASCSSPHTTTPLGDGGHTFEVRAIDPAGNVDPTPARDSFTVNPPPPPDGDGDGVPDATDACPEAAGTSADGCPPSGDAGPPDNGDDDPPGGDDDPPGGDGGGGSETAAPSIAGPRSAGTVRVSRRGRFRVPKQRVVCRGAGPRCAVKVVVTGAVPVGEASLSAKRRLKVRLGRSSFRVAAGGKRKVTAKLTGKGLKRLRRSDRIKARVRLVVRRGAISERRTVKITLKAPRRGGRRSGSRRSGQSAHALRARRGL